MHLKSYMTAFWEPGRQTCGRDTGPATFACLTFPGFYFMRILVKEYLRHWGILLNSQQTSQRTMKSHPNTFSQPAATQRTTTSWCPKGPLWKCWTFLCNCCIAKKQKTITKQKLSHWPLHCILCGSGLWSFDHVPQPWVCAQPIDRQDWSQIWTQKYKWRNLEPEKWLKIIIIIMIIWTAGKQ